MRGYVHAWALRQHIAGAGGGEGDGWAAVEATLPEAQALSSGLLARLERAGWNLEHLFLEEGAPARITACHVAERGDDGR